MRMLIVKQDTDLDTFRSELLLRRVSDNRAESAMASLQALNPHVDLKKLTAGTVLLVPDEPSFRASASDPVSGEALGEFQQLLRSGFEAAAAKLKTGNEARAAESAEVTAVLRTAAVKRIVDSDAELKQQVEEAVKSLKEDQEQAAQAEQTLEGATKAALSELAAIGKLLR